MNAALARQPQPPWVAALPSDAASPSDAALPSDAAVSQPAQMMSHAATNSVAQRALLASIRGYRRWASGRGPLSAVRCSFEHTESCSAYGLRVAAQAPSAAAALRLIRGRLRRCGGLRVHFDGGLLWGEAYDEHCPEKLASWAAEQGELPETQAMLARAARVIERPGWESAGVVQQALGTPRVLLRGGDGSAGQRMKLKLALYLWLPLILLLCLLCLLSVWFAPLLAISALLCAAQLRGAQRSLQAWRERVATLRAAREFEVF